MELGKSEPGVLALVAQACPGHLLHPALGWAVALALAPAYLAHLRELANLALALALALEALGTVASVHHHRRRLACHRHHHSHTHPVQAG